MGTARRQRRQRKRDAKKFVSAAVVSNAAVGMRVSGPVAEVPTAPVVGDEVCGCLDGDALFNICFRVLVPTLGSLSWWVDHRQSFTVQGCICRKVGEECHDPKCCWGNSLEFYGAWKLLELWFGAVASRSTIFCVWEVRFLFDWIFFGALFKIFCGYFYTRLVHVTDNPPFAVLPGFGLAILSTCFKVR